MEYKDLVIKLRKYAEAKRKDNMKTTADTITEAADAIEELTEKLRKERGKVSENNVVAIKVAEHGTNPM